MKFTYLNGWRAVEIRRAQVRDSLQACDIGRILTKLYLEASASTAANRRWIYNNVIKDI